MKKFINNLSPFGEVVVITVLIAIILVFIAGFGISYLYFNSILGSIGIAALCVLFSPLVFLFFIVFIGCFLTE